MTDLELFKRTTSEEELVTLAFSRRQENMRIGTHTQGCHTWGISHYECAKRRISDLEAQLPRKPITADMVTDAMVLAYHKEIEFSHYSKFGIAAAVNAYLIAKL